MFEELFGYALAMVKLKYPNEFTVPIFKKEVLELTDMIVEELYRKNSVLFFMEYTSKLPAWNDDPLCRELLDCVKE
jgi:hypothetical protein